MHSFRRLSVPDHGRDRTIFRGRGSSLLQQFGRNFPSIFPNGRLKLNPSPLVICLACTVATSCSQLLSATGAYLGRAHSAVDVHVIAHSALVVGYRKLPAFGSTGAGTVVRLARGNQCSCTSGRMITACALHLVMCCTTCSTVTGGGRQYPRGAVCPPGVTATFSLTRKEKQCPRRPFTVVPRSSWPLPPATTL